MNSEKYIGLDVHQSTLLKTDLARSIPRRGHFAVIESPKLPKGVLRPLQVKWYQPKRTG